MQACSRRKVGAGRESGQIGSTPPPQRKVINHGATNMQHAGGGSSAPPSQRRTRSAIGTDRDFKTGLAPWHRPDGPDSGSGAEQHGRPDDKRLARISHQGREHQGGAAHHHEYNGRAPQLPFPL